MTSATAHRLYAQPTKSGATKFFEAIGVGFLGSVLIAALSMYEAALLMLAVGAAHSVWPVVPALGFWTTYLLLVGLRIVLGTFKQPGKTKSE
jgi:hypothetical protein